MFYRGRPAQKVDLKRCFGGDVSALNTATWSGCRNIVHARVVGRLSAKPCNVVLRWTHATGICADYDTTYAQQIDDFDIGWQRSAEVNENEKHTRTHARTHANTHVRRYNITLTILLIRLRHHIHVDVKHVSVARPSMLSTSAETLGSFHSFKENYILGLATVFFSVRYTLRVPPDAYSKPI